MNSGVYKIFCTSNRKTYVGSAVDIKQRWRKHRSALRRRCHYNKHLQRAWNLYGEAAFEFIVIELAETTQLLIQEQKWIDTYLRADLFNIRLTAESNLGTKRSPETRKKMSLAISAAQRGKPSHNKGCKQSEETRRKCSLAKKGQIPWNKGLVNPYSESTKAKMSESAKMRKLTVETRSKISTANKGRVRGAFSEEHRKKLSEAQKRRWLAATG